MRKDFARRQSKSRYYYSLGHWQGASMGPGSLSNSAPVVVSEQDTSSRTPEDIAMMGIKLNAQVTINNLQNMHEKSLPPSGART